MPRDAVSRTAHVGTWLQKRNDGHKWVKYYPRGGGLGGPGRSHGLGVLEVRHDNGRDGQPAGDTSHLALQSLNLNINNIYKKLIIY